MADQETLTDETRQTSTTFNPAIHGLWKRFVENGTIRHGEWLRACAAGEFVGTCRHCGDYLIPAHPLQVGQRWDYEAQCRSKATSSIVDGARHVSGCGHVMAAPGGRLKKPKRQRSTRTGGA